MKGSRTERQVSATKRIGVALALALSGLVLTGCGLDLGSAGTPAHLSVLQLASKPKLQIGKLEGDSDYVFGNVVSVRHLSSGNILVADAMANEILEYTPDGGFIRRIGGKGDGPGEFRRLSDLYITRGDSIFAEDAYRRTVSVFDSAGHYVGQAPGSRISGDSIFSLDVWLYGRFWVDGALTAYQRKHVRSILDKLPQPTVAPGYRYVRVDQQGRLWVREPGVTAGDAHIWTIIDTDGKPSASVAIPVRFDPEEIRSDEMTGRWLGEKDVSFVRTYKYGGTGQDRETPAWLTAAPPEKGPPADQAKFLAAVKASLKQLASAQEIHYAKAYTYSAEIDSLSAFHPDPSIQADIVQANTRGWTAVFAHPGLDRICGLAYGGNVPPGWDPGRLTCGPAAGSDSTSAGGS